MSLDVAIAPSVRSPGAALKVNLLAGAPSPASASLRVLIVAPKGSGGTATADTLNQAVGGADDVGTLLAGGTVGHVCAKALFAEYGLALVDVLCVTASAGVTASNTFAFAGTVTSARTVYLEVMGRERTLTWAAGETATAFAARVAAEFGYITNDVMCTASANTGTLTVTAKIAGTIGNDVIVRIRLVGGSGGTVDAAQSSTKNLASGTSSATIDTGLALVQTTEYAFILNCDSNEAANTSGASTTYAKVQAHIALYQSGLTAKLQQQIVGFTGTLANALTAAGYRNIGTCALNLFLAARSLPSEVQGAECGARLREILSDPAVNRIGMEYSATLYGPIDAVDNKLTDAEVESALQAGVTPISWGVNGTPYPVRPITTYYLDGQSNADDRLLDTSRVDGTYSVARDLRTFLYARFKGKKLLKDIPAGQQLPPGCVLEKTVRTAAITRVRFHASIGVVQPQALEDAIANGEFVVQVDPSDSSQIDLVVPVKIVPPLAKLSIVVNHVGP